jgi:hypothetical protein
MDQLSRAIFKGGAVSVAILLLAVYYRLDPAQHFFPKCPSLWLTGFKCPGCGTQRALHQLLHGHWAEALQFNALMVVALPYALLGIVLEYTLWGKRLTTFRRQWYGNHAARIILVLVVLFCLARNIWDF